MTNPSKVEITMRERTAATVRVTVDGAEVASGIGAVYTRYANELSIPGFRRGRVPKSVLESRFGQEAFLHEAKEDLLQKHLSEALDRLALHPVSTPRIDEVSFDPVEGYVFDASFSVLPDVDLPPYRGLEVEVPVAEPPGEKDVEATLEEVRTRFGTLADREGDVVSEGDIVRVRERDAEWDTRAEAENPLTGRLVGRRVGESVDIEAPPREGRKPFRTKLEVVGLRQIVLPAIDDDLAKDAGFDSLAALHEDIATKLAAGYEERRRRLVEGLLLDALVEKAAVPLPEPFVLELVEDELNRIRKAFEGPAAAATFEQFLAERETTEESLRNDLRSSVERRLRRELVLRALAEAEGVAIEDSELENLAEADAKAAGEDPMRFVARLRAEDRWDDYRTSKVTERLLGVLREAAVLRDAKEA